MLERGIEFNNEANFDEYEEDVEIDLWWEPS